MSEWAKEAESGWLRLQMAPVEYSAKLWSYAPDEMQPLDRRPFGFKGKGFIYCQLCRGELVKVVHDGVLGCCIHRYLPEHTPLSSSPSGPRPLDGFLRCGASS